MHGGIIPARAGFTTGTCATHWETRDHPRSRGVYPPPPRPPSPRSGSSPLARGLLGLGLEIGPGHRIIPARAGFTSISFVPIFTAGDHPRSRGVYHQTRNWNAFHVGSSPLARGLPRPDWEGGEATRIIPARAGFTSGPVADRRPSGDHPRSRGVYVVSCGAAAWMMGSSPLARGLPTMALAWAALLRIIPARAGFTGRDNLVQRPAQDHPRSRGVYGFLRAARLAVAGSSPLARGLRPGLLGGRAGRWIIPARAGFTDDELDRRLNERDHPRSRGVYPGRHAQGHDEDGSSPLARGLLRGRVPGGAAVRIIPARAGFTPVLPQGGPVQGDHPRSRGVYPHGPYWHGHIEGSSPLARGLQATIVGGFKDLRIIPARAGFTPTRRSAPPGSRDHPRSRGVYKSTVRRAHTRGGSSPLARGLLRPVIETTERWRIIPARAGFTRWSACRRAGARDHPRSRGVYGTKSDRSWTAGGSSPLARGLLDPSRWDEIGPRIIPARAGFTRRRHPGRGRSRDHPRSRGVYAQRGR